MNLNCYVIDDERHAIGLLSGFIEKTPGLALAGAFNNPLAVLQGEIHGPPSQNITFLDIDMPQLSGLDLAGLIRPATLIVFTTAYRQYGPEAFAQDAADYLLKPISYERFLACVQRVRSQYLPKQAEKPFFFVKSDIKGKLVKVPTDEIRYISSLDNYVEIHLEKDKIVAYLTLGELADYLPAGAFSRIQKSVIVAHRYVRVVEHFQVRLQDQTSLPVGKVYSRAFLDKMNALLLISKRKDQGAS